MNQLSVATIAALAAGASLIIGAFAAAVVTVIQAWRSVATKVTSIDAHVNSERTAMLGREATLKRENELLQQMLIDQKVTAALLAQAAVQKKEP